MCDGNIPTYIAAKRMHKSVDFVRNAIEKGTMPGSYTETENGVRSYHIPPDAFEDYMAHWRPVMSKDIAMAILEAITSANAKNATEVAK